MIERISIIIIWRNLRKLYKEIILDNILFMKIENKTELYNIKEES